MTAEQLGVAEIAAWLREAAAVVRAQQARLTSLDAAIGDGDHGLNRARGFDAVERLVNFPDHPVTPGDLLAQAGRTFQQRVGGASGPIWGIALRRAGQDLGDRQTLEAPPLARDLDAARAGVVEIGAAAPRDKTMVDALAPAVDALQKAAADGLPSDAVAPSAARPAEDGVRATTPLLARRGRAAFLGERSISHQGPGATSVALVLRALAGTICAAPPRLYGDE